MTTPNTGEGKEKLNPPALRMGVVQPLWKRSFSLKNRTHTCHTAQQSHPWCSPPSPIYVHSKTCTQLFKVEKPHCPSAGECRGHWHPLAEQRSATQRQALPTRAPRVGVGGITRCREASLRRLYAVKSMETTLLERQTRLRRHKAERGPTVSVPRTHTQGGRAALRRRGPRTPTPSGTQGVPFRRVCD